MRFNPSVMLTLFALSPITPLACADEAPEPTLEQRIDVLADCVPTDLEVSLPWSGPAFDPATGELREPLPAGHVEAVVTGWRDYSDAATKLREQHGQRVFADVFTRDGLLGFQGVESDECDLSMSHTLWRDEAAMFAFVAASAHAKAMGEAAKMHHATAGAHWVGEARDAAPSWKQGVDRLVQELRGEAR